MCNALSPCQAGRRSYLPSLAPSCRGQLERWLLSRSTPVPALMDRGSTVALRCVALCCVKFSFVELSLVAAIQTHVKRIGKLITAINNHTKQLHGLRLTAKQRKLSQIYKNVMTTDANTTVI